MLGNVCPIPRSLDYHDWTNLSLWQGLVPCRGVQSCGRAAKCLAGCFPLDPGRLCVGLCYLVALLHFLIGCPLRPLHPSPLLGELQSLGGHKACSRHRALEAAAGRRGRKGTFSWSRAPEAAGVFLLLLQSRGLPSFSVAKLSDLGIAASGLCVAPVQAQLALMNCCSLFPPLF